MNDYDHNGMPPSPYYVDNYTWLNGPASTSYNHFSIRCTTYTDATRHMIVKLGAKVLDVPYTHDYKCTGTVVLRMNLSHQGIFIKVCNLLVNGIVADAANLITKLPQNGSTPKDQWWVVSGIQCNTEDFFEISGDIELSPWGTYDNGTGNGQDQLEIYFGYTEDDDGDGDGDGEVSGGEVILDFNPCNATEVDPTDPNYVHYATDGMINEAGNPEAPDSATAPDWCMRPRISDCFINGDGKVCGLGFSESSCYGSSSLLEFEANPLVTSDRTTVQEPIPDDDITQMSKHLLVAFRPADLNDDDIQTIIEVGGAISGFNVYIQNGKLIMGIWNRMQRYAFVFDEALNNTTTYLAHMELIFMPAVYDIGGVVLSHPYYRVRMILNGATTTTTAFYNFKGLQWDPSQSAIGGESHGTTFNVNWGVFNDYARWFTGCIGRILLYGGEIDPVSMQGYYDTEFNNKYGTHYIFPVLDPNIPKQGNWRFVDNSPLNDGTKGRVELFPNPANGNATLDLVLAATQQVKVELFDMSGAKMLDVFEGSCAQGRTSIPVNCGALPAGVYAVRVSAGEYYTIEKFINVK